MKSNTEVGFLGGSHPLEGLKTILWQQCEPWGLQGGWLCPGLSPARLRPGKYHKVRVPLGTRYPAPSCLRHSWEVFGAFFDHLVSSFSLD